MIVDSINSYDRSYRYGQMNVWIPACTASMRIEPRGERDSRVQGEGQGRYRADDTHSQTLDFHEQC